MNTILVVDDDFDTLILLPEIIRRLLRSLALGPTDIYTASSGKEALNMISDRLINLLITDYHMPGCSGIELINSVKKGPQGMTAILMSSDYDLLYRFRSLPDYKIDAVLEKPVNGNALESILQTFYSRSRSVRELPKDVPLV